MKNLSKYFIASLLGLFVLVSCEKPEGALYSGEANKTSFFGSKIGLILANGTLEIPIARTSTESELTVPVTLTAKGKGFTDVFKISAPVKFANGEAKTYVKVAYSDFSVIDPSTLSSTGNGLDVTVGLAYNFTLSIDKAVLSNSNVGNVDVTASSTLKFEDIGNATINSEEGWEEATIEVPIQKAVGVNVYKLIKPFGYNNFAFMINSDNTVTCPVQAIFQHPSYGPVSLSSVKGTYTPSEKKVVLNVGGYTVSAGSFGSGKEIIYLP